jgi:uncharacterized protein YqgC (DUF456 family)
MRPTTSLATKLAIACLALLAAFLLEHAGYLTNALPVTAIIGMAWISNEALVKNLAALGLADETTGVLTPKKNVSAKTADYTVTGAEPCGTVFTTRGAAGAVIFTLPAAAARFAGLHYRFKNLVDQNMTVTGTVDTMITFNDTAADSVAASTAGQKIGAEIEAFCDGTSWCVSGVSVGHTFTVAT